MQRFISGSMFVALVSVSAWAQGQAENIRLKLTAEGKTQIEQAVAVGAGTWVELKTVKGAPYSATAESETIQILTDGNRIRNKTTTTIYRDSEGRTRREVVGKTPEMGTQVFISDPVIGANYSLNSQQRVAVKSQVRQVMVVERKGAELEGKGKSPTPTISFNTAGEKGEPLGEAQRDVMEQKLRQAKEMAAVSGQPIAGGVMARKKAGTQESLGQQMIEGVMCEGKRTTVTIPAGSIGNDLPINIVSEEWYSPELQALVLTKQSDPRHGETIYRLTNINRSEPARSLFEVPVDYTLKDTAALPMKKMIRDEQE